MSSKKIPLLAIVLVLAMLLVSNPALADDPVITEETVLWNLSKVTVVNPGERIEMPEGIFVQGIVLEAKAKAKDRKFVREGSFTLTMDAFWPLKDMPAQDAGFWYIQGSWSIAKKGATANSLKARHSRDVIQGRIKAQLTFNPLETDQAWSALATVPMSPALGRWSSGEGALSFDASGEGSLSLELSRSLELR